MSHQHTWGRVGLWSDGALCTPCRDPECDVALCRHPDGTLSERHGWGTTVHGIKLDLADDKRGGVAKIICREITEGYALDALGMGAGDVVLDIGAHVGVVSTYLGKRYPKATIYAFEPVPDNFNRLQRNLDANGVTNVTAYNQAVSGDGRPLDLHFDGTANTGGGSAFSKAATGKVYRVPSITLDYIWNVLGLDRVALLKIDCEGAEYEILHGAPRLLDKVGYLVGEFHTNSTLTSQGYTPKALRAFCAKHIDPARMMITDCQMGE